MDGNDSNEIKELLKDLIWLNGVMATELIQITENTSRALHGGELPDGCRTAHAELRERTVGILRKYRPAEAESVADHVLKH
ncbi:MAG: hypothetical protein M1548_07420 [Actinobacteria bacterium]|nr:hypothetical protein [Actinomycetota bacterium]